MLAAQRRTATDIAHLREYVREMGRSGHSRQSFAEADLDFHLAVAIASGNPLLRSMASVIEAALAAPFSHSSPIDDAEQSRNSRQQPRGHRGRYRGSRRKGRRRRHVENDRHWRAADRHDEKEAWGFASLELAAAG